MGLRSVPLMIVPQDGAVLRTETLESPVSQHCLRPATRGLASCKDEPAKMSFNGRLLGVLILTIYLVVFFLHVVLFREFSGIGGWGSGPKGSM